MSSDESLLRKYVGTGDAEAFAQLVEQHAGLVYATCLRVTGSPHDAEDAAQECFLSLARNAKAVRSSLPGWLHATARNAALALVKKSHGHGAGDTAMKTKGKQSPEPTWYELEPHIDAAIHDLPDELRTAIILHFLEHRPQSEVAEITGVDQSAVSRRVQRGIDELRRSLKKAGVVASAAVLATLLTENAASAAPATLTAAAGKIALGGVGTTASTTGVMAILGTAAGKVAAVAVVALVAVAASVVVHQRITGPAPEPKPAAAESGPQTDGVLLPSAQSSDAPPVPEPGPERSGLRLRLTVTTERQSGVDRHEVRLEVLNVTKEPITLLAGWPYDANEGNFREYVEQAVNLVASPEIGPWEGQIMGLNRTSPQPEHVLTPNTPLVLQWKTVGRSLKNKVNRVLDVRTQALPTDGLYSVHAAVTVHTRAGAVSLKSNEQKVPVGGSTDAPKHPLGRIVRVAAEQLRATIDVGRAQKIALGDQFVVRTGMTHFWRLTIDKTGPNEAEGRLVRADFWGRDAPQTKPALPRQGQLARLMTGKGAGN